MQSTRYSCQILMKLEFPRPNFEESSKVKFYKNPPSDSQSVPYEGWTDRLGMIKLIVAFCTRNFANAPKGY
jgi:hypothetical protein